MMGYDAKGHIKYDDGRAATYVFAHSVISNWVGKLGNITLHLYKPKFSWFHRKMQHLCFGIKWEKTND